MNKDAFHLPAPPNTGLFSNFWKPLRLKGFVLFISSFMLRLAFTLLGLGMMMASNLLSAKWKSYLITEIVFRFPRLKILLSKMNRDARQAYMENNYTFFRMATTALLRIIFSIGFFHSCAMQALKGQHMQAAEQSFREAVRHADRDMPEPAIHILRYLCDDVARKRYSGSL